MFLSGFPNHLPIILRYLALIIALVISAENHLLPDDLVYPDPTPVAKSGMYRLARDGPNVLFQVRYLNKNSKPNTLWYL